MVECDGNKLCRLAMGSIFYGHFSSFGRYHIISIWLVGQANRGKTWIKLADKKKLRTKYVYTMSRTSRRSQLIISSSEPFVIFASAQSAHEELAHNTRRQIFIGIILISFSTPINLVMAWWVSETAYTNTIHKQATNFGCCCLLMPLIQWVI